MVGAWVDRDAVLAFVLDHVNTFPKWDLVRYFYDNPEAVDTQKTVASCLGRSTDEVATALDELAASGILILVTRRQRQWYRLNHDPAVRVIIHQFLVAVQDRQFHMMVTQRMMAGLR